MAGSKKISFSNIKWDTDGLQVLTLPEAAELEVDADLDVDLDGADALSDKYGYCVKSFAWESMKDRNIAEFKLATDHAKQKGLEILPSVDGPYVFNPSTETVVGRKGSEEYRTAVSEQPTERPRG